jgi:tetraacyldisaccharide 4'-kinase
MEMEFRSPVLFDLEATDVAASPVFSRSLAGERLFLFCAIGSAEAFRDLIAKETGAEVVGLASYPDHHFFSRQDCEEIARKAKAAGATRLICTEKDSVKLETGFAWRMPVSISRLEAIARGTWDELHARMASAVF